MAFSSRRGMAVTRQGGTWNTWRMNDSLPLTPAVQIVAGLLVLLFGRRLFWLFVGAVGFFIGLQVGMKLFAQMAEWMLLLLSILVGLVFAGLTIVLQRLAVILAGALVGGMLAVQLAPVAGLYSATMLWGVFVAGGVLAAVLLYVAFDPMLILLSAIVGTMMISNGLHLDPVIEPVLLVVCLLLGLVVQFRGLRRSG